MLKIKAESATLEVIEYLLSASPAMLEQFELSRLANVVNMQKQISAIMQQAIQEAADALLARTLRKNRKAITAHAASGSSAKQLIDELMAEAPKEEPKLLKAGKKSK